MDSEGEYQEAMKFISPDTYSKANEVSVSARILPAKLMK
jgi:hypothetical protein